MPIGVVIAGVDRSTYLDNVDSGKGGQSKYSVATGQRGTCTVSLRVHPGDTYSPLVGYPISLYDQNGHRVFGGLIVEIVKTNEGNTQEICYVCTGASFERMLDKHRINPASFFNQSAGYIFKAIFNALPGETITLGQVDDGPTIPSAVYRHEVVTTVFDDLATQANFVWGVDPDTEKLYFRSPTSVNAPFDLTGDPTTGAGVLFDNVASSGIEWDTAQQDFRSRQYITVNMQPSMLDTDLITGDGKTTTYPLIFPADTVAAVTILSGAASSVGTSTAADLNTAYINVTSVIYHLVSAFDTTSGETQVLLSGTLSVTLQNLADAINGAPTSGSNYQVNSGAPAPPNPKVTATIAGNNITIVAIIPGTSGNSLEVGDWLATNSFLTWSGPNAGGTLTFLSGGSDGPTRASVDGVFNAVVFHNETVTIDGLTYTFVTTIDNTVPYQVSIGTNVDDCASRLVEAIGGAPHPAAGTDFSLPTMPHPTCVASWGGGGTGKLTVFAKTPGAQGNNIVVSANSLYFFWGAGNLSGGIDGPTIAGTVGTGGTGQDWSYAEGSNSVTSTTPLPVGVVAAVSYYRLGVDIIGVENTSLANARAAVEGGSGIYQALIDVSSTTDPVANDPTAAVAAANSLLTSYGLLTQTLTFYSDSPGWQPGQALKVNLSPPYDTTLNGTWLTSQIDGSYIPGMPGWRYQVQAIAMSLNGRAASPDMRANTPVVIPRKATWQMLWHRLATVNPRRQKPGGGLLGSSTILSGGGTQPGGPGGGGTAGPAPPVTITGYSIWPRSNETYEVAIAYTVANNASSANYSGVAVYLEDPDISSQPAVTLDGSTTLGGTKQVSGIWSPTFENDTYSTWVGTTETHEPADLLIDNPKPNLTYRLARNVRIYLASFGASSNPTLVRANQPNPTPNIMVPLPAPNPQYARGEEYAWLVTNCQIQIEEDFNRPDPQYRLLYSYTPPDPNLPIPQGMRPFGGVEMFFAYPDANNTNPLATITDSGVFVPETASNGYESPVYTPGNGGTFRAYFCSGDNSSPAHVNSLIPGVTPYVQVTIVYPPSGPGTIPQVGDISKFTIPPQTIDPSQGPNPRLVYQPDGSYWGEADLTWILPANTANFSGLMFYKVAVNGNPLAPPYLFPQQTGNSDTSITLVVPNLPSQSEKWTILAISVDASGRLNNDPTSPRTGSPEVIWTIGPVTAGATGKEYAPNVTPIALPAPVVDQQLSSDGVMMSRFTVSGWTNPTGNNFGGVKIAMQDSSGTITWFDAGKAISFTTPWAPAGDAQGFTFYIVSYNPQNQLNTIAPGITPSAAVQFTPQPGKVKASLLPTDWFNQSEFTWPVDSNNVPVAQGFSANQIEAGKIFVGSVLRVGGAPSTSSLAPSFLGQNGQIAVYSSGKDPGDQNGVPTLRAWMGQQTNILIPGTGGTSTQATVYGGWFAALYVGGGDPTTSPLYVSNGGLVQLGGWDVQNNVSPAPSYYPYISVRDKTGQEQGRMGASLAANPDGTRMVIAGDVADIGGAWFHQFACGGADLAHWQLLCPGDKTLRLRNINTFEIDYAANVVALPAQNAPYQLLLGTDEAFAGIGKWEFPGITLMRQTQPPGGKLTTTTHGITIINRGIILGAADSVGGQTNRVALVTFNGDSAGGDAPPFWGELDMYSPTTGIQNVMLYSGYNTGGNPGGAGFFLKDAQGHIRFEVRSSDYACCLGTGAGYWGIDYTTQIIDSTGKWIGAISASDLYANDYWVNAGPLKVIDSTGTFVGANINIGANYWINSGQITASNLYIRVAGVATQVIDGNGNWTGNPIAGVSQTPWASNIDANGYSLTNIAKVQGKNSGVVLVEAPTYIGQAQLTLTENATGNATGGGLLVCTYRATGGNYPNINIQPNSITMLNSAGSAVFEVDLNGVVTMGGGSLSGTVGGTGTIQLGGSSASSQGWVLGTQFGISNVAWGAGGAQHATLQSSFTFATGDGRTVTVTGGLITDCK